MLKVIAKIQTHAHSILHRLRNDDDGASLIEYTVLIGLITVAVIALIGTVGGKIVTKWTTLNNTFT